MAPIFWHWDTVVFESGSIVSMIICLVLGVAYVASLYIGGPKQKGLGWFFAAIYGLLVGICCEKCSDEISYKELYKRDHPDVVKHRIVRVCIICLFALPFLWLCSSKSHSVKARPLITLLGLRFEGCILATILPLILTMILFMGPLSLHYLDGIFMLYKDPKYWFASFKNLIWMRNHVVAPLSEEFIYRACMLPVLVPALGETWSVFICPLFFGVAHVHHMIEKVKDGVPLNNALIAALFQFSYTTVFGAYSAFLFLRTGHFMAPVVAHAFCNHMGFPNFREIEGHRSPTRYYVAAAFVLGLVLWYQLLYFLTTPSWYGNDLYVL